MWNWLMDKHETWLSDSALHAMTLCYKDYRLRHYENNLMLAKKRQIYHFGNANDQPYVGYSY